VHYSLVTTIESVVLHCVRGFVITCETVPLTLSVYFLSLPCCILAYVFPTSASVTLMTSGVPKGENCLVDMDSKAGDLFSAEPADAAGSGGVVGKCVLLFF
jgi:hypothetical protein